MPLRGKILNTFGLDLAEAYENEEVRAIFTLLGTGGGPSFNIKKLRYDKIIIATDSDPDGSHISLLITALILRHAPKIIEEGRLYQLVAPFYGVGSGKNYKLLYSDKELEEYEKIHGKQSGIDRFKGLGSMPKEMVGEFLMGDKRKILQVKMEDLDEMVDLFEIFLGESIEERRNLVRKGEL